MVPSHSYREMTFQAKPLPIRLTLDRFTFKTPGGLGNSLVISASLAAASLVVCW